MSGPRSAWMAARARNAARQQWWIGICGTVALVATLLVLVLVPRRADQQLQQRLAALPPAPDSLPIQRRLDSLRTSMQALDLAAARAAAEARRADSTRQALAAPIDSTDATTRELLSRIIRARTVALPESYRALANAPRLRALPRAAALLDSIDRVEREREAHAALGGPGARYAALTARLTELGQALIRLGESQLTEARPTGPTVAVVPPIRADSAIADSARTDSTGSDVAPVRALADSTAAIREALARQMAQTESLLPAVRLRHAQLTIERESIEQRRTATLPPLAMLAAALLLGLSTGYAVVLARELRRPTVGDEHEVERLTDAPVLWYGPSTSRAAPPPRATRERPGVPAVIDRESDTFTLLHLALTGVGDIVREVEVRSDSPAVAAAVALSTAAAAARESRAVLVRETAPRGGVLASLIGANRRVARAGTLATDVDDELANAVQVVTLDRDAHIDVMPATAFALEPHTDGALWLAQRYDLQLILPPSSGERDTSSDDTVRDVVLCARRGATPLAWLASAAARARVRQQRVRAVVLWSRATPRV